MADINIVMQIGRLTRNAELKYTSGGMAVCTFSIAVNRKKKVGDDWVEYASFFNVVLWGKQGETLIRYLLKGKQVAVSGWLHQNRWEQEGQTRSKIEIMAEDVELLGGAQTSESGHREAQSPTGENSYQNRSADATAPVPQSAQEESEQSQIDRMQQELDDAFDPSIDDIPF